MLKMASQDWKELFTIPYNSTVLSCGSLVEFVQTTLKPEALTSPTRRRRTNLEINRPSFSHSYFVASSQEMTISQMQAQSCLAKFGWISPQKVLRDEQENLN